MVEQDELLTQIVADGAAPVDPFAAQEDMRSNSDSLSAAADEVGVISRTVNENGTAYLAIESFMNTFMNGVSLESWDKEAALHYQRGMAGVLKTLGVDVPVGVAAASFEAAGVTQTNEENRDESQTKGKNILVRIWEAISKALVKFGEVAKNFISRVGASGASIQKASADLKAKVAAAEGEPDVKAVIDGGGWGKYAYRGSTLQTPAKALDFIRLTCLNAADAWSESFDNAVVAVNALATRKTTIPSSAIWTGLNDLKNMQSDWPGGVTMSITGLPDGAPTIESMVAARMKLNPSVNTKVNKAMLPLDRNACNAAVSAMKLLGDEIVKSETALNKLSNDLNSIKSAIDAASRSQSENVPDIVKKLPGLISSALQAPQVIYPYAAKVAEGAFTHVVKSIATWK